MIKVDESRYGKGWYISDPSASGDKLYLNKDCEWVEKAVYWPTQYAAHVFLAAYLITSVVTTPPAELRKQFEQMVAQLRKELADYAYDEKAESPCIEINGSVSIFQPPVIVDFTDEKEQARWWVEVRYVEKGISDVSVRIDSKNIRSIKYFPAHR